MSLYNALFGMNEYSDILLRGILGKTRDDFGRFRDVYVTEEHVVVHTRCGGGNREWYQSVFEEMAAHPLFDYDEDDDFDCTYADFFFRHPAEYAELLKAIAENTVTPGDKWQALFEKLDKR